VISPVVPVTVKAAVKTRGFPVGVKVPKVAFATAILASSKGIPGSGSALVVKVTVPIAPSFAVAPPEYVIATDGPPTAALALDNPTTLRDAARKPVKANLANFEVLEGAVTFVSWSVIVVSLVFD
jgi:hypothetical protein